MAEHSAQDAVEGMMALELLVERTVVVLEAGCRLMDIETPVEAVLEGDEL